MTSCSWMKVYVDGQEPGVSVATSGPIQDNSSVNPASAFIAIGGDSQTIPALNYANLKSGSVTVTPSKDNVAPTELVAFSLHSGGVTVTEAGVLSVRAATAFRMYVEAAGTFGDSRSIQGGFAVSNVSEYPISVLFELTTLSGASTGLSATLDLPARGQTAMFLNQIKGFQDLPSSFKGALRISTAAASGLVVTGLRSRFNERGDFLVTTTAGADEASVPPTAELFFPQIADGGGYTTVFILLSGPPGQVLPGRIRFFSSSGQPMDLTFP
jgi:hypothetical protein